MILVLMVLNHSFSSRLGSQFWILFVIVFGYGILYFLNVFIHALLRCAHVDCTTLSEECNSKNEYVSASFTFFFVLFGVLSTNDNGSLYTGSSFISLGTAIQFWKETRSS